jgi:hypothetical protein
MCVSSPCTPQNNLINWWGPGSAPPIWLQAAHAHVPAACMACYDLLCRGSLVKTAVLKLGYVVHCYVCAIASRHRHRRYLITHAHCCTLTTATESNDMSRTGTDVQAARHHVHRNKHASNRPPPWVGPWQGCQHGSTIRPTQHPPAAAWAQAAPAQRRAQDRWGVLRRNGFQRLVAARDSSVQHVSREQHMEPAHCILHGTAGRSLASTCYSWILRWGSPGGGAHDRGRSTSCSHFPTTTQGIRQLHTGQHGQHTLGNVHTAHSPAQAHKHTHERAGP